VYACRDGTMLFVRDRCEPPREAVQTHGPLSFRGHIAVGAARSPAWRVLLSQIAPHLFATVSLAEVALLLGRGAAGVCDPPSGPSLLR